MGRSKNVGCTLYSGTLVDLQVVTRLDTAVAETHDEGDGMMMISGPHDDGVRDEEGRELGGEAVFNVEGRRQLWEGSFFVSFTSFSC